MFYSITFAPAFERDGASEMMETWRYPWVGDEVGWAKR